MEMKNKTDNSCSYGGDLLAYLYDELPSDGRERFETHLERCFACIDEFAELSQARYSVYEWKNIEFAPLETPRFVIPVEKAPARASWLDSIRAAFAWNGVTAAVGGVAVLFIGVFTFAMFYNSSDESVVANVERPHPAAPTAPAAAVPPQIEESAHIERPEAFEPGKRQAPVTQAGRSPVTVRKPPVIAKARPVRDVPTEREQTRRTPASRRLENSPTLGQYTEDGDETLRLSDLFDDLDSRELD